jgi:hypothetical protein
VVDPGLLEELFDVFEGEEVPEKELVSEDCFAG